MKCTVGADPELFIYDKKRQKYVSALEFIPGTKEEPFKVKSGAVQVDGISAEFNIDPAGSSDEFEHNMVTVLTELRKFLPKDCTLHSAPTIFYGPRRYNLLPDKAKILGCDPDYVVTTVGRVEQRPTYKRMQDEFHGSGHIHIGWTSGRKTDDQNHLTDCASIVTALYEHNVAGVETDWSYSRRHWYGLPKVFRPKSYGVEYRTPSNAWVARRSNYKRVFNNCVQTFEYVKNYPKVPKRGSRYLEYSYSTCEVQL